MGPDKYLSNVDAPPNFWEDHDAHKLVFQPHGIPLVVLWGFLDAVRKGEGVDPARAALVDALFDKHGVDVGRAGCVGWQGHWLAAHHHWCVVWGGMATLHLHRARVRTAGGWHSELRREKGR